MIPYVDIVAFRVGPLVLPTQRTLAVIGIVVVYLLFRRQARRWNLDPDEAGWLAVAMLVAGLAGAFLFRWIYVPDAVARDPWIWTKTTAGAASFGGFAGGLLAAPLYFFARRIPAAQAWKYLDALALVFPAGWLFGRLGCSLVHDHPGVRSSSWLAVAYPGFPRYDLAVLEVLFLGLVLIPAFWRLAQQPRPARFYLGAFLSIYGVFRVLLDRLHVDPPTYVGFTVDQWGYGAMTAAGLAMLVPALTRSPKLTEEGTKCIGDLPVH